MGFDLGGLFGGGGGGSQSASVQQVPTMTEAQRKLIDQWATLISEQLGQGVPAYSGQMTAPLSPLQQQGMGYYGGLQPIAQQGADIFQNALSSYNPQAGQNYLNQGQGALNTMLADYDPASDMDYWQNSYVTPALRNYQQNILPQITEKYAGANAGSSGALNRSLARSSTDLSSDLNAQLANLMYQGRNAQLGRQQQGVNQALAYSVMPGQLAQQAGQIGAMGMDTMSQVMNAGQLQQTQNQNQLSEEYQKWLQGQAYSNPWLGYTQNAYQPQFENIATVNQQSPGFMQSTGFPLLGAFMGSGVGQNMMSGMFSGLLGGGGGAGNMGAASNWFGSGGADAWMNAGF